jgi:hypothetical protein
MKSAEAPYPQDPQVGASRPGKARARATRRSWLVALAPEIIVALAFVAVQANGVLNMGFAGQDFNIHMRWMEEAAAHPWRFLTENQSQVMLRTNPPLYHLLAAAAAEWGPLSSEMNIGVLNLFLGLSGLLLFMATARLWIASTALRSALYLILAFLPVFCIQTLVMAADVLTMPAGGMLLLGVSKLILARGRSARAGIALIAGGLLLGMMSKFTFLAAPWMVLVLAVFLFHRGRLSRRLLAWLALAGLGVPMLVGAGLWWRFHTTVDNHFAEKGPWLKTNFSLSDLLLIRSRDRDLLNAIPYAQRLNARALTEERAPYPETNGTPGDGHVFVLIQQHRYSYQALLVNALFTDVMNVRQPGRSGLYFGPRSLASQSRMNLAIRSGWVLYFGTLLLIGWALFRSLQDLGSTGSARSTFTLATLALSSLIIVPILSALLFVFDGYTGGYWMPRLILFPLAATLLACFIWVDQLNSRFSRRLACPLLIVALWQSLLSLSFLVV